MMRFLRILLGISIFLPTVTFADNSLLARQDVRQFIQMMVKQHHFKRQDIVAALKEAKFQPQIVESMDKPYEKKTWDVYRDLFLQPERVQAGLNFWQANQKALARAEQDYGVPADMIVAIIGVETLYGKHQGTYRVLDALTTLAFYYPKRSEYFTKELSEFFLLCREQGVAVNRYNGSYAGAMGKPQFMPSSYRFYAVDYTGKGHSDLMNNDSDAIGSVANFFHRHGWQAKRGIAQRVEMRGIAYRHLAKNSKMADYSLQHLLRAGVKPLSPLLDHSQKAGVIELETPAGQEYWLAYPNFYVITHYNRSPQYALVVYLFAQQLHKQWAASAAQRMSA
jgi:membrane-bound lytic murein transglycosylase B